MIAILCLGSDRLWRAVSVLLRCKRAYFGLTNDDELIQFFAVCRRGQSLVDDEACSTEFECSSLGDESRDASCEKYSCVFKRGTVKVALNDVQLQLILLAVTQSIFEFLITCVYLGSFTHVLRQCVISRQFSA